MLAQPRPCLSCCLVVKQRNSAECIWTVSQLNVGGFDGNGKLDDANYQTLRAILKEMAFYKSRNSKDEREIR